MMDDIVEMILKEARAGKYKNLADSIFVVQTGLYSAWDELRDKVHLIMVEQERLKWRKKEDENKG